MTMSTIDRAVCLDKMHIASDAFYKQAVLAGNHAFIEFNGLITEYIKICEDAHHEGIDFTQANKHSGLLMEVPQHRLNYLYEKLECIFAGFCPQKVSAGAGKEQLGNHVPKVHAGRSKKAPASS